jgi:hypothetical protein
MGRVRPGCWEWLFFGHPGLVIVRVASPEATRGRVGFGGLRRRRAVPDVWRRDPHGCNVCWVCSGEATPSPEGGGLGRGVRTPIDLRVCGFVLADPRATMRVGWLRFVISISASSAVQSEHNVSLRAVRVGDTGGLGIRERRGCNVCWVCSGEATPSPEGGGLGRGVRTPIDWRVCGFVFAEPLTTMRVCWLRLVTLHLRLRLRVLRELRGSIRTPRLVKGCTDWRHLWDCNPGMAWLQRLLGLFR